MEFSDFSPPCAPSLEQQCDALQKGLGRAVMWASTGRLDQEALLDACLHDKRYDTQCEDERTDWLWNIMRLAGAKERFRDAILQALNDLPEECGAFQLCGLGRLYAESGDEPFRTRLYEIVETRPVVDNPWLGDSELVELDGEAALLFSARAQGARLAAGGDWDEGNVAYYAVNRWGEQRTREIFLSSSDSDVRRYLEKFEQEKRKYPDRKPDPTKPSFKDSMLAISAQEIIDSARLGDRCDEYARRRKFRNWGRHAEDESLQTVFEAMCKAGDPDITTALLRVFGERALPRFDDRLVDLCRHGDEELQKEALRALSMNSHAAVRKFALEQLAGGSPSNAVSLFQRNYAPGDEDRMIEAIPLPEDPDRLHSLLTDINDFLAGNDESDCSRLGVIAYIATPCQICRRQTVGLLTQDRVAPAWLVEECRHDSDEDCQELAFEAFVSNYTVR